MMTFLICGQLMRHLVIKLSDLLQMLNDCRMINVEFFSNFLHSCNRISFADPLSWSLSTSNGQPLHSSPSRLSSPLQNFLNHHYTVCSLAVSWAKCIAELQVAFCCFTTHLNRNKKIAQICFLSNIISRV